MSKTILFIDDEINILNALKRMFHDYYVLTALNAQEALEILKNYSVQVIISDQRMPNMTGTEFFKVVADLYPDIIRIILSGHEDFPIFKDYLTNGTIYKFISKPWNNEQFHHSVRKAFILFEERQNGKKKDALLAHYDSLTRLQNRLAFNESLYTTIQKFEDKHDNFAVICIDIDRFSNVNNLAGEQTGDKVLKNVANRLKRTMGPKSVIARMGSDEFAILVTEKKFLENVDKLFDNLFQILKKPMKIENGSLYLTYSMGMSMYPQHGNNSNILMKNANNALHYSLTLGGDHYHVYDAKMNFVPETKLILEADLHSALENNEFIIYYQPIFDANTNKVNSVEALLRWQHPTLGLVPPMDFLPLCEETGLIVPIGEWLIRKVAKQIKQWHTEGFTDLFVAVNLTTRQFNYPGLLDLIKSILKENDIPASALELEITESLIMQNVDSNIPLLKTIRDLGVKLALDDFGTGFSSLSYLKNFPFNTLKIDKSFIDDVAKTGGSSAIVDTIIALGESLGLTLIAEGVEHQDQLELLKTHHCNLIQGFLYSKPVPENELTKLLHKTNSLKR